MPDNPHCPKVNKFEIFSKGNKISYVFSNCCHVSLWTETRYVSIHFVVHQLAENKRNEEEGNSNEGLLYAIFVLFYWLKHAHLRVGLALKVANYWQNSEEQVAQAVESAKHGPIELVEEQ